LTDIVCRPSSEIGTDPELLVWMISVYSCQTLTRINVSLRVRHLAGELHSSKRLGLAAALITILVHTDQDESSEEKVRLYFLLYFIFKLKVVLRRLQITCVRINVLVQKLGNFNSVVSLPRLLIPKADFFKEYTAKYTSEEG